jgi:hypothetical protein
MKSTRTLTEIVFFVMFAAIVIGLFMSYWSIGSKIEYKYGVNGPVDTMCIDGYKVLVARTGHPVQLIDNQGHGVPCGEVK